jgi:hypothetical protein
VIAAGRGGVFTLADALACGYTREAIRHAVKSGRLRALQRGVYVSSKLLDAAIGPARHALMLAAIIARLSRRAVGSHESALLLYDVALYRPPGRLSLTSDTGVYRSNDHFRVCVAALAKDHVHADPVLGVATCTAARALVDVARGGDLRTSVVPLEDALHRGLVTKGSLAMVLGDCAEWPGASAARDFVDFAEPKSESPAESLSRCVFREQDIEMPESQVWIAVDADVPQYRVDFYWRRYRVIGEVDGKMKYLNPEERWLEKRREEHLMDDDHEVVRWSYADVRNRGPALKAKILRSFARATRRFGLPS